MSGAKHTPGPWRLESHYKHGQAVLADESLEVALCWRHNARLPEDQMYANARLIAAAPDLLTALVDLYALVTESGSVPDERYHIIANAATAIGKATGEAQ